MALSTDTMLAALCGLVAVAACAVVVFQLFRSLNRTGATVVSTVLLVVVMGLPVFLARPALNESTEPVDLRQVEYEVSTSCKKCPSHLHSEMAPCRYRHSPLSIRGNMLVR